MLEVTKVIMLVLLEVVKNFCSVMSGFESVVAPVTGGASWRPMRRFWVFLLLLWELLVGEVILN